MRWSIQVAFAEQQFTGREEVSSRMQQTPESQLCEETSESADNLKYIINMVVFPSLTAADASNERTIEHEGKFIVTIS
jgi:hypothetical protein